MTQAHASAGASADVQNFNWMLNSFVQRTSGVRSAIAVSSDGLLMAASANIERANADRFAAIVSGMSSLSDGAARTMDFGALSQVIVEMRRGYLFVAQISGGSCLGVAASSDSDVGVIGYEMTLLVQRFGQFLTPALVTELQANLSLI
jgi:predicted regulator of Ras-like GTPase activity (Roadblock/LC7/MglB family)